MDFFNRLLSSLSDEQPARLKVVQLSAEGIVATIREMSGTRPEHAGPLAIAFFQESDRFYSAVKASAASAMNLQFTQAAQFECRVWCLSWLEYLMRQTNQPDAAAIPCLRTLASLVAMEYQHDDTTQTAAAVARGCLSERRKEYVGRIREMSDGGNPAYWFLRRLKSACTDAPGTADSALTIGKVMEEFAVSPVVLSQTRSFLSTMIPLFKDTPDFVQMPLQEFTARATAAGLWAR